MKHFSLSFLLVALFMTACQNEDSLLDESEFPESELVETEDLILEGSVIEYNSIYHYRNGRQSLHDVSVKIMFLDVVIDEVNTDESGRFAFVEQAIPKEGAYLLFEAPSFYPNVIKIDSSLESHFYYTNLIRLTFDQVQGESISSGGPYINITGLLQEELPTSGLVYYITDELNQLVGAGGGSGDFTNFQITTLADQHLLLHYKLDCFEGSMLIGPYSEDTDVGVIEDPSVDLDLLPWDFIGVDASDCNGTQIENYGVHYTVSGLTYYNYNGSGSNGFGDFECSLENSGVVTVTVATQNPRKFSEQTLTYFPGQNLSMNHSLCEDDDTYINYSIGGGEMVESEIFTFVNVLENGPIVLKQVNPVYQEGTSISFEITEPEMGMVADGNVYLTSYISNATNNILSGSEMNVTFTSFDEVYIEGTFDGPVYDVFENPLGNLTGTFRARVQY